MGKSSSSLKKKHSKKSSKARKSSKSKSRRYRKREQRKFDHDDSTSLSSSSEDSYRVRRVQTHTKREVKGRRKRAEKRSYSCDSSEDSLHVRKRKRSKRKNDYEVREKPYKKKKIRGEASVSSMSSRSQSCSTCGTASSDGSEFENHRGRSGRKEDNRRLERGKSGSRKSSRYRARSCSSCSHGSESLDERNEEKYTLENNSRWLRSVITVTNKDEEGGELCGNQYKEEIVDDHDYPSRSNDSNDGASKRELNHGSLPALEEKVRVEDEKGGVGAGYGSTRDRSYNDGSQYYRSNIYDAGTSESIEKKTSENSGGSLDADNLESILRQKALENLRKFRGEIQSTEKAFDQKDKIASVTPPAFSKKYEQIVANTMTNNVSVGANCDKETLVKETCRPARTSLNGNKGKLESAKLHSTFAQEKVIEADSETGPASVGYRTNNPKLITSESHHHSLKVCSSLKQKHAAGHPQEKMTESSVDKHTFDSAQVVSHTSNDNVKNVSGLQSASPKPSCPIPIVRNSNLNKEKDEVKEDFQVELKQTSAFHELPDSKSLVTEGDVDKNSGMDAKAAIQSVNNNSRDNNLSGENSLNKSQDGASQGSPFEQKTMNVMRGGEMVQVSYKVYIPKKAPALARRQLKR